jgi:hypothetical protein
MSGFRQSHVNNGLPVDMHIAAVRGIAFTEKQIRRARGRCAALVACLGVSAGRHNEQRCSPPSHALEISTVEASVWVWTASFPVVLECRQRKCASWSSLGRAVGSHRSVMHE